MIARDKLAVSSVESLVDSLSRERRLGNICACAALVHTEDPSSVGTTLLYEKRECGEPS